MSHSSEQSLTDILVRQKKFSQGAFGPGPRTKGILEHIRRELLEIQESPGDLYEWIDVAILALDGALRAGYEPSEIEKALVHKISVNEKRVWPDWRQFSQDDAIEHKDL